MAHIFISYSKTDIDFARRLRSSLQNKGFAVWMDETKLVPSERWWPTIEQNITTCGAFIVIMSPNSKASDWVEREILVAERHNPQKPIFPILLAGDAWSRLGNIQYEDMRRGLVLRSEFIDGLQQVAPPTNQPAPPPLPGDPISAQLPTQPAQERPRPSLAIMGVGIAMLVIAVIGIALMAQRLNAPPPTPSATTAPAQTNVPQVVINPTDTSPPSATASDTPQPTLTLTDATVPSENETANPLTEAWLEVTQTREMLDLTETYAQAHTEVAATLTALAPTLIPLGFSGNPVTSNAQWTRADINQYDRVFGQDGTFAGIEMVLVPAGCFHMGDPSDPDIGDGGEQCFDAPFYISRYEMTNAEFSHFSCTAAQPSRWKDDNRPRERVSWFEARDCAAKIDQQLGDGQSTTAWRLPTEAEWEYAGRGPDDLIYPWGNVWNPENVVWSGNSGDQTAPVGSKGVNGESWLGANDLAGNVWEWVSSLYKPYPYSAGDGREDLTNDTDQRVMRGASFLSDAGSTSCAFRIRLVPGYWDKYDGFRVVLDGHPLQ